MRGATTEREKDPRRGERELGELRCALNWPLETPNSKPAEHAEDETRKAEKITY